MSSPLGRHLNRFDATQTLIGGYFLNNSLLVADSRNVSLRNIATLCPSGIISKAFVTNSVAKAYGGLLTISPSHTYFSGTVNRSSLCPLGIDRKSSISFHILSTMSDSLTSYPCAFSTFDICPSPQAGSHIL